MAAPTPRDETLPGKTHHYRTGSPEKCAEMTEEPRRAHARRVARLYGFSTANKIFCTKTAQCVYAEYFAHPPFTQQRGEPVTFLVVTER
ncbi:hypothetical protein PS854_02376 [Pseudomonas fluorescens]|uniref:Uncharacterized protein n=1 Tax=Pseudomonas fluorescens TaxID=294 RepID=A0A5E7JSY9_PSEFL|nr:hypothetical protein PS854_02376 [Pseudomonas fluorescens]